MPEKEEIKQARELPQVKALKEVKLNFVNKVLLRKKLVEPEPGHQWILNTFYNYKLIPKLHEEKKKGLVKQTLDNKDARWFFYIVNNFGGVTQEELTDVLEKAKKDGFAGEMGQDNQTKKLIYRSSKDVKWQSSLSAKGI